jgi:hypothetical protein
MINVDGAEIKIPAFPELLEDPSLLVLEVPTFTTITTLTGILLKLELLISIPEVLFKSYRTLI